MATLVKRFLGVGGIGLLSCLSLYLVWGWVTLADIRNYCEKHNLDFEKTLLPIASSGGPGFHFVRPATQGDKSNFEINIPGSDNENQPLIRLRPYLQRVIIDDNDDPKKIKVSISQINLFYPFVFLSENVVNTLFIFAGAYLIGVLILFLRFLRRGRARLRAWFLRPLAGAFTAATFWLLFLAGVGMVWSEVSSPRATSLGVFALFGAIYYERVEGYLQQHIQRRFVPSADDTAKPE
jgi:hypothetical protein